MVTEIEEKVLKHKRIKQIILRIICAVVILLSGVVIGAGGTILLVKHRVIWIPHRHDKDATSVAKEISSKYGLNPQQTSQVEEIFNKAFERRKLRGEEMRRERENEAQILSEELEKVLTPEQFERWSKDFQDMREKFRKRFEKK